MKWKKLGKLFDPTEHQLANNCDQFAQSPQALVFDHFIRIYFSTRQKENSGKFLSYVSFVDMDKSLKKILNISKEEVIPLGDLGCFDEHGIFPMSPCRFNDKIFAYTTGWSRRVSVSVETSIGFSVSNDQGKTFQKLNKGPVLSASLNEPFLVGDAFVRHYANKFHMWYIYGTKWSDYDSNKAPDRVYKIGHATSEDGIVWIKEGRAIVEDKLNLDECQALPSVEFFNNQYHMFFCYRQATDFRKNKDRGYRIGYAYSNDLINWQRDDQKAGIDLSETGWDSQMNCYPHVFSLENKVYLLYNGNEFGRFGFGALELE